MGKIMIVIIVNFFLLMSLANAGTKCMGEDKVSSFIFAAEPGSDGSLIVSQNLNGSVKRDVLDDTGFLSARILSSYIASAKDPSSKKDSLRLLQLRLNKFKKTMEEAGFGATSEIGKKIDQIKDIFNQTPIEPMRASGAWMQLERALDKEQIKIMGSTRKIGAKAWGPDKDVATLDLPVILRSRSMACEPLIRDLQLGNAIDASISKVAPASYSADDVVKALLNQKNGVK